MDKIKLYFTKNIYHDDQRYNFSASYELYPDKKLKEYAGIIYLEILSEEYHWNDNVIQYVLKDEEGQILNIKTETSDEKILDVRFSLMDFETFDTCMQKNKFSLMHEYKDEDNNVSPLYSVRDFSNYAKKLSLTEEDTLFAPPGKVKVILERIFVQEN